jgi:hypothetical protein
MKGKGNQAAINPGDGETVIALPFTTRPRVHGRDGRRHAAVTAKLHTKNPAAAGGRHDEQTFGMNADANAWGKGEGETRSRHDGKRS